jgi:hypothetical protein
MFLSGDTTLRGIKRLVQTCFPSIIADVHNAGGNIAATVASVASSGAIDSAIKKIPRHRWEIRRGHLWTSVRRMAPVADVLTEPDAGIYDPSTNVIPAAAPGASSSSSRGGDVLAATAIIGSRLRRAPGRVAAEQLPLRKRLLGGPATHLSETPLHEAQPHAPQHLPSGHGPSTGRARGDARRLRSALSIPPTEHYQTSAASATPAWSCNTIRRIIAVYEG